MPNLLPIGLIIIIVGRKKISAEFAAIENLVYHFLKIEKNVFMNVILKTDS